MRTYQEGYSFYESEYIIFIQHIYLLKESTYEYGKPTFVIPDDWKNFQPKVGCGTYDFIPDCWLNDKNIQGFIYEDIILFINKKTLTDLENSCLYTGSFLNSIDFKTVSYIL